MFAIDASDPMPLYAQLERDDPQGDRDGAAAAGRQAADGPAACRRSADQCEHGCKGLWRARTRRRPRHAARRGYVRAGKEERSRLAPRPRATTGGPGGRFPDRSRQPGILDRRRRSTFSKLDATT